MHENYIRADVDIITINSYASARHNLEPAGLSEKTMELNLRAIMLAEEAGDRCANTRMNAHSGQSSEYFHRA